MICLWPCCLGRAKERRGGGSRCVLLRGVNGEDGGRAGRGVLLEAVSLAGAHFGESAGKPGERDDQGTASLAAAVPARQAAGQQVGGGPDHRPIRRGNRQATPGRAGCPGEPLSRPGQLNAAGGVGSGRDEIGGRPSDISPPRRVRGGERGGGTLPDARGVGVNLADIGSGEQVPARRGSGQPGPPPGAELPEA